MCNHAVWEVKGASRNRQTNAIATAAGLSASSTLRRQVLTYNRVLPLEITESAVTVNISAKTGREQNFRNNCLHSKGVGFGKLQLRSLARITL